MLVVIRTLHHRGRGGQVTSEEDHGVDDGREAGTEARPGIGAPERIFRPGAGISAHDREASQPILLRARHRAANVLVLDDKRVEEQIIFVIVDARFLGRDVHAFALQRRHIGRAPLPLGCRAHGFCCLLLSRRNRGFGAVRPGT